MNDQNNDNPIDQLADLEAQDAEEVKGGSDEQKKRSIHIYTAKPGSDN